MNIQEWLIFLRAIPSFSLASAASNVWHLSGGNQNMYRSKKIICHKSKGRNEGISGFLYACCLICLRLMASFTLRVFEQWQLGLGEALTA